MTTQRLAVPALFDEAGDDEIGRAMDRAMGEFEPGAEPATLRMRLPTSVGAAADRAAPQKSGKKSKPTSERLRAEAVACWHVVVRDDEKPKGPLSAADIQRLWLDAEINSDALCWREGLADWQPLWKVRELAPVMATAAQQRALQMLAEESGTAVQSWDGPDEALDASELIEDPMWPPPAPRGDVSSRGAFEVVSAHPLRRALTPAWQAFAPHWRRAAPGLLFAGVALAVLLLAMGVTTLVKRHGGAHTERVLFSTSSTEPVEAQTADAIVTTSEALDASLLVENDPDNTFVHVKRVRRHRKHHK